MSERGLAAAAAGVVGLLADLVVYSGDLLIAGTLLIVTDVDLFVMLFGQLRTLANFVSWIPESTVESLYVAALLLFVIVIVYRIGRSWRSA